MHFFLGLIIFLSLESAHAYSIDRVRSKDTIESIAKRNIDSVRMKYGDRYKEYEEDIKEWNPKITDWKRPPINELLYVDYPYNNFVQGAKWTPDLGKYVEDRTEFNQTFSLFAFYAATAGAYKETTAEQTVVSGQNFPVTLGLGFSSTNEQKKHFIQGSGYWAQATKGKVGGNSTSTTEELSVPGEMGFNLYYQYYLKENLLGLYSGYDFEKLNTLNTSEMLSGSPVVNVVNNIHYATMGAVQGFSLFDVKMSLKASFSKTLSSSSSQGVALTGYKYMLYYTLKPEGRLSYSFLYKHHELKGSTQLSIDRVGVSVGIFLF